jgi:hypothetical protein
VNGVDGEAAILRRDSFMNNYTAMRKKKESRYVPEPRPRTPEENSVPVGTYQA